MVFSSLAFLWMFLPIVFAGYFVVPEKAKNIFLCLGGAKIYFAYAAIYFDPLCNRDPNGKI